MFVARPAWDLRTAATRNDKGLGGSTPKDGSAPESRGQKKNDAKDAARNSATES